MSHGPRHIQAELITQLDKTSAFCLARHSQKLILNVQKHCTIFPKLSEFWDISSQF